MVTKQQSAGGIIYYIDATDNTPRFLLVKRHALSNKIERIAPKGKIQNGELPEQAALREIEEEVGLSADMLQIRQVLDTLSLQLYNDQGKLGVDKDITYFLVHFSGSPDDVRVADVEGYVGMYKWVDLVTAFSLVEYRDMRELIKMAHDAIGNLTKKDTVIDKLF